MGPYVRMPIASELRACLQKVLASFQAADPGNRGVLCWDTFKTILLCAGIANYAEIDVLLKIAPADNSGFILYKEFLNWVYEIGAADKTIAKPNNTSRALVGEEGRTVQKVTNAPLRSPI